MAGSLEQSLRRVMSGESRGVGPALLRGVLRSVEPLYTAAVGARNRRFDRGDGVRRLPRAVVSVGNLTAGGTGKTPVVAWLCHALRSRGLRPAVLLRGYKSTGPKADEQLLLERELNATPDDASLPPVIVHADPDRFRGGAEVLREHPEVDVFVLDDGFQHRRLHRDFDLVLIDAANPFGYGHVHPRGLLREPLHGLGRADAILLTRRSEVDAARHAAIVAEIQRWNPRAPLYESDHVHTALRSPAGAQALDALAGRRFFAFCGIGNPESFARQLRSFPGHLAGHRCFADHHPYSARDIADLQRDAESAGADVLVTTEKDWVKLAPLVAAAAPCAIEIWRIALSIRFHEGAEDALLNAMGANKGAQRFCRGTE